uniref:Uncharacterized protein n=1 Tax=Cannabis sativa TaxID=3483 RepID=A0A803PB54_CANSA
MCFPSLSLSNWSILLGETSDLCSREKRKQVWVQIKVRGWVQVWVLRSGSESGCKSLGLGPGFGPSQGPNSGLGVGSEFGIQRQNDLLKGDHLSWTEDGRSNIWGLVKVCWWQLKASRKDAMTQRSKKPLGIDEGSLVDLYFGVDGVCYCIDAGG